MMTDPIADMLTRIRNAQMARKTELTLPASRIKKDILDVLVQKKYLTSVEIVESGSHKNLKVVLADKPLTLKRLSKPGQRNYAGYSEMRPVLRGLGISIVSTSKGVMTHKEAKKQKVGGEVLCEIY